MSRLPMVRARRTQQIINGFLYSLALLLGALQTWHTRHRIFSDGISYLEIAGKYAGGDWRGALNAYWSPLYSWMIAAALLTFHPTPYWQVATLHLVNFLVYAASLMAAAWLLRELFLRFPEIPRICFYVSGFTSFMLAGLFFIGTGYCSPDMIAFGLLLMLSAMVLLIQRRKAELPLYALTGLAMGLTFLARAAFAPLAIAYIVVLLVLLRRQRRAWIWPILCTSGVLLLTAGPFVTAISLRQGRLTFGESGRLNYGWEVAGAARSIHWQGEPNDIGKPVHPTTLAAKDPDTYVFDGPGTYSPWYDPALWYEGIQPKLKLASQARVFFGNLSYTLILLCLSPVFLPALLLTAASGRLAQFWRRFASFWPITIPCLAGMGLYCCVFVDKRYIAGFLFVIWMTAMASIPYANLRWNRLLARTLEVLCVIFLIAFAGIRFREPARVAVHDILQRSETEPNLNYLLARRFEQIGLKSGDKIAYIGLAINADWARLDGVRIVSEIPVRYLRPLTPRGSFLLVDDSQIGKFWRADRETQEKRLRLFRKAGAKMVVTDGFFYPAKGAGWEPVLTPAERQIHFGSGQYPDQAESRFYRLSP